MEVIKRVLVAVDGSEDAARATKTAAILSKKFGAELIVCHVIPTPAYYSPEVGAYNMDDLLNGYFEAARTKAKSIVDKEKLVAEGEGVKAEAVIEDNVSSVVEGIVTLAEKRKVDLIVIGTRGQSGFKRLLIGSVSSGVLTHAHCSVLVVR